MVRGRGSCLGRVGGGRDVASRASPVGVHVVPGRAQQLVRVRAKIVPLCLHVELNKIYLLETFLNNFLKILMGAINSKMVTAIHLQFIETKDY